MAGKKFEGKTALVTGAAKRIGREIALALAESGANVVVHFRDSDIEATALASKIESLGRRVYPLRADLEEASECAALIPKAFEIAGSLDFLVNNASIYPADTLASMNFESFLRNMKVNAWAPFVLSREFANRVQGGRIVNLLDTRVDGYDWKHASYILSKHTLAAMTEMMAIDFAPRVAVNAVSPGLILPPPGRNQSYLEALAHTTPMKKHGSPRDVAEAVVYLLSSDFLTGEVIHVDGGRNLLEYPHGPHSDQ